MADSAHLSHPPGWWPVAWLLQRFDEPALPAERHADWLRRCLGIATLLLTAVTWPLWIGQESFPQIPLFSILVTAPGWWDNLAVGVLLLGAAVLVVLPWPPGVGLRGARAGAVAVIAAWIMLWSLDQHRLQPWAWHAAWGIALTSFLPARTALALARMLLVSVYFFSALAKVDMTFASTLGQQFLGVGLAPFGQELESFSSASRNLAALGFPLVELLIAVGLCSRRLRRAAAILSILMHVAMLAILGPWGLGHQLGVLCWNLVFIAHNALLFLPLPGDAAARRTEANKSNEAWRCQGRGQPAASALIAATLFVMVWPVTEPLRWCDPWLAWGLYAPRVQRVQWYLPERAVQRLPARLQRYCTPATGVGELWQFRLDQWSLAELNAPLYPGERFSIGLIAAVTSRIDLQYAWEISIEGTADRILKSRRVTMLHNQEELRQYRTRYWFNTTPRDHWQAN